VTAGAQVLTTHSVDCSHTRNSVHVPPSDSSVTTPACRPAWSRCTRPCSPAWAW
jgi:hypothetical protein